jgi:hypothetical protein
MRNHFGGPVPGDSDYVPPNANLAPPPASSAPMSTGTKVLIGVGATLLLGAVVIAVVRR